MSLPGVTVRPLGDLRGSTRDFNEIFFDEVEVPLSDLLGPENGGWNALRTTLNAERSGVAISRLGYCRRALAALERCWESLPTRVRASSRTTDALAELKIQVEVLRLLSYRVAWEQEAGLLSNVSSSGAKLFGGELQQKLYESIFALWPEAMQLMPGSSEALLGGFVADHLLESTSATIAGGTSEILRTLIARRGLGLTA
jgi:alkylation response protein AidB-like acyl-CoA dehydrogenase